MDDACVGVAVLPFYPSRMERLSVDIRGVMEVPLRADRLAIAHDIDADMHREIVDEAARIAVSEKLAGFQRVRIARAAAGDCRAGASCSSPLMTPGERLSAVVEFDELSACIARLVAAFDSVVGCTQQMEVPIAALDDPSSSPEQRRDALNRLKSLIAEAKQYARPSVEECPAKSSDSSAGPSGTDDEQGELGACLVDPSEAGYALLADDDGEQDPSGADVVCEAESSR